MITTQTSLLLKDKEVVELLGAGIGTRTLRRWVTQGKFPRPVRLGGRTAWKRRDVERFILEADGDLRKFNRIRRGEL